jgi:hypothetical protein
MELFLNLCWLSLLAPGYLLWRQRSSLDRQFRTPLFLCALGCAFVLLFPVISASDDLHAMRPEIEESERAFRSANQRSCPLHVATQSAQPFFCLGSVYRMPASEQVGTALAFVPQALGNFSAPAPAGRAPPASSPSNPLTLTSL